VHGVDAAEEVSGAEVSGADAGPRSGKVQLDDALLTRLGLGDLPTVDKLELLKRSYAELERRVGESLVRGMTTAQLDEFEAYYEKRDDEGAFRWLQTNVPGYRQVVQDQFATIQSELRDAAPLLRREILDAP